MIDVGLSNDETHLSLLMNEQSAFRLYSLGISIVGNQLDYNPYRILLYHT